MSNILSKSDIKNDNAAKAEADRKASIEGEVSSFTDQIVEAMRRGESYLSVRTKMPEPETQARLTSDFASQGWTLSFRPARTGGSISWS